MCQCAQENPVHLEAYITRLHYKSRWAQKPWTLAGLATVGFKQFLARSFPLGPTPSYNASRIYLYMYKNISFWFSARYWLWCFMHRVSWADHWSGPRGLSSQTCIDALCQLSHPNIIQVSQNWFLLHPVDDLPVYMMELGRSAAQAWLGNLGIR